LLELRRGALPVLRPKPIKGLEPAVSVLVTFCFYYLLNLFTIGRGTSDDMFAVALSFSVGDGCLSFWTELPMVKSRKELFCKIFI
jgi:hypothetical protein